jgi:multicomponent Na+:H+ antiporter subunit B
LRVLGVLLLGIVTLLLLVAVQALPPLRSLDAPLAVHVDQHYREHTLSDMATPNVVTSVLADYRGYDTFGETTVIFAAGLSVYLLLRRRS